MDWQEVWWRYCGNSLWSVTVTEVPFLGLPQIIIEVVPLVPTLIQLFIHVIHIDTTIPVLFFRLIFYLLWHLLLWCLPHLPQIFLQPLHNIFHITPPSPIKIYFSPLMMILSSNTNYLSDSFILHSSLSMMWYTPYNFFKSLPTSSIVLLGLPCQYLHLLLVVTRFGIYRRILSMELYAL